MPAFILTPAGDKKPMPRPWIFYAPTLPGYPDSHEKWMHEQFVAAGVAVAGIDVGEALWQSRRPPALHRVLSRADRETGLRPPAVPAGPQPRRPVGFELGHRKPGQGRRNRRDLSGIRSDGRIRDWTRPRLRTDSRSHNSRRGWPSSIRSSASACWRSITCRH